MIVPPLRQIVARPSDALARRPFLKPINANSMKKLIVSSALLLSAATLSMGEEPYQPNWESLAKHRPAPEWLEDAKLGIYFHWGPYSVPAFDSAWYPRNMYIPGHQVQKHHKANYGPVTEFGYENFIPLFRVKKGVPLVSLTGERGR